MNTILNKKFSNCSLRIVYYESDQVFKQPRPTLESLHVLKKRLTDANNNILLSDITHLINKAQNKIEQGKQLQDELSTFAKTCQNEKDLLQKHP